MIMALNAPEVHSCKFAVSRKDRALFCDDYIREFDRRFADWVELALVLIEVEKDELWKEFPDCHSWDEWLVSRAPVSHRLCYAVKSRLINLQADFTLQELKSMPPQTAEYVKNHVPPAVRKDPRAKAAATKKPKEAVAELKREFPNHHFEEYHEEKIRWADSAWAVIMEAFEAYRVFEDETISFAAFIEWCANDYLDSPNVENPNVTNRQAWRARK